MSQTVKEQEVLSSIIVVCCIHNEVLKISGVKIFTLNK